MAITVDDKQVQVFDRSLLYISLHRNESLFYEEDLSGYCRALIEAGTDRLIVNAEMMQTLKHIVPEIPLLCIASHKHQKYQSHDCHILNVVLSELTKLTEKIKRMKKKERAAITAVCLSDFDMPEYEKYQKSVSQFKSHFPDIAIGISPGNAHHTGAAAVTEIAGSFDFVIGSFAGAFPFYKDAPLEEIFLAANVFSDKEENHVPLRNLQYIKKMYENIAQTKIDKQKSVIGDHIFYYESAIHADGIEKNPKTYEPFTPESVGLKRKMFVGKHSGVKSIEKKIFELSLNVHDDCLEHIKEKVKQTCLIKKGHLDDEAFSLIVQDCLICR